MAFIELKNIEKSFGSNKVINKFDIKINDGEFVVLVGPSGCGKSTLLRMISGLESVDIGEIYLNNKGKSASMSIYLKRRQLML